MTKVGTRTIIIGAALNVSPSAADAADGAPEDDARRRRRGRRPDAGRTVVVETAGECAGLRPRFDVRVFIRLRRIPAEHCAFQPLELILRQQRFRFPDCGTSA